MLKREFSDNGTPPGRWQIACKPDGEFVELQIAALAVAANPVVISDRTGKILWVNSAFEQMTGYTSHEAVGQSTRLLKSDCNPPGLYKQMWETILAGQIWRGELVNRRRDGRLYEEEMTITPVCRGAGEVTHFIAIKLDITERRKRDEALRQSEERMRLLLDSTGEGIYGIDIQGKCIFLNKAFLRILGYGSPEEVLGKDMHALIHHTRQDGTPYPVQDCRIYQAFLRGEGSHVDDEVLRRRDGTPFPAEYWSYPMRREGAVVGAVVTFIDITERKRTEKALRESEASYRSLVKGAVYGICRTLPLEDKFLEVNPALVRMLGYESEAELLDLDLAADVYRDPAERARVVRLILQHGRVEGVEAEFKRKDQTPINVRFSGRKVEAEDRPGAKMEFEFIVEDVTELRKLELQFRQAQKMEAVGRLAGGIAHDFNNLLSVILGYTDLLRDRQDFQANDAKRLDLIHQYARRGADLTRQLLAFSRQQVLAPRVLNLNAVLKDSEDMLRRLIGEDVELVFKLGSDLACVRVDEGQIVQVLMNLAVNARDAMPDGGKLTVETTSATLDESYAHQRPGKLSPGDYVLLAVSDTGAGMDAETKAKIFEPFFTTKERGKGTGLGLATVYGIVKQSGGFIWVYSEPGQGSSFKLYLPQFKAAVSQIDAAEPPEEPPRGTETVLLSEDEESLRKLTAEHLTADGYRVLEAENPAHAIELAERHEGPIHLLLTDVIMPNMNGSLLAKKIQACRSETRVLFMSGYAGEAIIHHGVLAPGTAFLQKPFSRYSLACKLRDVLGPTNGNTGK